MRKEEIIKEVFGGEAALTPSDLLSKEFKRAALGGYNTNDVDEFLEHVADVFERLITQVRALKDESEAHRERLEEYRQMEATLRNALVSSQKFGEDIVEAAKREATVLIEEARLKKAQAQLEASKIPLGLSQDIILLQQQRNRLRVEMTAILETHRNLLDSLIPLETVKRPASVFEVAAPAPTETERLAPGFEGAEPEAAPRPDNGHGAGPDDAPATVAQTPTWNSASDTDGVDEEAVQ